MKKLFNKNSIARTLLVSITISTLMMVAAYGLQQPGTDVQVTSDPNNRPQMEPSIGIDPANQSHILVGAMDFRDNVEWVGYYTTFNAGTSWTNQLLPDGGDIGTRGNVFTADPVVAFDNSGTAFYLALAFVSNYDASLILSKSFDGGLTFSPPSDIMTGFAPPCFDGVPFPGEAHDKPWMALDKTGGVFKGRIYVSWTLFNNMRSAPCTISSPITTISRDIMFMYSSDGGLTWSNRVRLSTSNANEGTSIAVGPSGEVYVAWNDVLSSTPRIMVAKSTDGGSSFQGPFEVSSLVPLPRLFPNSAFRVNSIPSISVNHVLGNLVYVTWPDYRLGNADILFSYSFDGGNAWQSPIRVNNDATSNDQFFPAMSVSNGRIDIIFYDRRLDPTNHNIDVFHAQSLDGGASFANVRVTDTSFDPLKTARTNQPLLGDYIGIASTPTRAYAVWADTRRGETLGSETDIFFDMIATTSPGSPDFSMTANVTAVTIKAGEENPPVVQITLTSLNGFAGTITLTSTPQYPDPTQGPIVFFDQATISLTLGAQGYSTMYIYTCKRTPNGDYNFTVTGTSGSLSHPLAILVTVKGSQRNAPCPI